MVTLWRERHGLCKSHFVERNWYMFPAKIYPAEIFPRLCRPNILELSPQVVARESRPLATREASRLHDRSLSAPCSPRMKNGPLLTAASFFPAASSHQAAASAATTTILRSQHIVHDHTTKFIRSPPTPCNSNTPLKRFYTAVPL